MRTRLATRGLSAFDVVGIACCAVTAAIVVFALVRLAFGGGCS